MLKKYLTPNLVFVHYKNISKTWVNSSENLLSFFSKVNLYMIRVLAVTFKWKACINLHITIATNFEYDVSLDFTPMHLDVLYHFLIDFFPPSLPLPIPPFQCWHFSGLTFTWGTWAVHLSNCVKSHNISFNFCKRL